MKHIGAGAEMAGQTTVNIDGYTVDDSVNLTDDLLNISSGSTLVLLGDDTLTYDRIDGAGRVSVRGSTTIDDSLVLSGLTSLVNTQSLTQVGSTVALGQSIDDAVVARNVAGGTWTFINGSKLSSAGTSKFVNLGILNLTSGVTIIDANFYDRGTIEDNDTLELVASDDSYRFIDDKIEGPGALITYGNTNFINTNISTLTIDFYSARIVGDVRVSSSDDFLSDVNLGAGSVLQLANSEAHVEFGDEIIGAGTLTLRGDDTLNYSDTDLIGAVTVENFGDLQFDGSFTAKSWSGNVVTIENAIGATWTSDNYGEFTSAGAGGSVFINEGTFIAEYGFVFGMSVVNDGVIETETPGNYNADYTGFTFSSVTGVGVVDVGPGTVTVDVAASGQTFNFDPALTGTLAPTLNIEDPQNFAATIAGFDENGAKNDVIVVKGVWRFDGYQPDSSGAGGSLVLVNGSTKVSINLAGSYDPYAFATDTASSQTTITYDVSNRTVVNVTSYAVDDDVDLSDDTFYLGLGAAQVLVGDDMLMDDAFEGAGRVSVRGPTTINDGLTLTAALLVNSSQVTQNGSALTLATPVNAAVIARNTAHAIWTLENGASIAGSGLSQFVNLGAFDQTNEASTISALFIDREGTIEANGFMVFASQEADRFVNDAISGSGTFDVNDGAVLDGSTVSTSSVGLLDARIVGNVDISSAALSFEVLDIGAGAVLDLTNPAAAISIAGGGEVKGAGTLEIKGDDSVSFSNTSNLILVGNVTFANYGATTFTNVVSEGYDSGSDNPLSFETTPWAGDIITIENEAGATWTDSVNEQIGAVVSSSFSQSGSAGSSVFINNGTFNEEANAGVNFGMSVVNNGVIQLDAAFKESTITPDFVFDSSLNGSGTVNIGVNEATLDGAVAAAQTLDFVGANLSYTTLFLNDAQEFAGTVAGFAQITNDRDLITLNSTSGDAPWQFQGYQSSSGALDFTNASGGTAAVHLAGVYNADDFHAVVSGSSTTITYG